ncbi:hypothetical protein IQ266_06455 [filamentous cyanobacterium LEGE 11480]|uniref:Uncharacterized protein n=1 Tax=Romeriopsis navalis LEGE 11480 TaxID=2777977 RepID=A0A928Z2C7_9CYAN|nr:hypothetical protein [Romeriopsis navalis]MBE9029404.1 hypothetical protein [Romeriopsis navalis LEGE 11480]
MQQYSLQQRFQGALLGQAIAQQSHQPTPEEITSSQLQHCIQWLCQPQTQIPPQLSPRPIQAALNLLPLWLYGHESWRQRQAWLRKIPDWETTNTDQSLLWLYGEAIAQTLRLHFQPQTLIQDIQQRWQQHADHGAPPYVQQWHNILDQIQQWQNKKSTLAAIKPALAHQTNTEQAISIVLYSFITMPYDLEQALYRSDQLASEDRIMPWIRGLIGSLIGAYRGWPSLPSQAIHQLMGSKSSRNTSIEEHHTYSSEFSILPFTQASQQLIQTWSGAMARSERHLTNHVTTVPNVFAPR